MKESEKESETSIKTSQVAEQLFRIRAHIVRRKGKFIRVDSELNKALKDKWGL